MLNVRLLSYAMCTALLAGCATNWPAQLDKHLGHLDNHGLVLTTVTFHNTLDSTDSMLPALFLIGKNGSSDYDKYRFLGEHHLRALNTSRNAYLIVMEQEPGSYVLHSVRGTILGDIFQPLFEAPLLSRYDVASNTIRYIGHIHLILRNRTNASEMRAGPVLPLLDQAVIAGATFDVEITDKYAQDMYDFAQVFPNLRVDSVVKDPIAPWKRPSPAEFEPKNTHFFFF